MSDLSDFSFANLPLSLRVAVGMIGGGGGAFLAQHYFHTAGMVVFLCGIIVIGLLLLVYALALRWMQNRRAARFSESVQNQSASAPSSLSKAEQIAKLDDLRHKFEEGVETFRRAGKDFYSLPWYLLIGESGSGKTEAMRRSGVGFPAGVQDYLQGVGGTINMHWWFTNQAVVLDLAGRVVFGEVASGATSEWETFLRLLKKNRPDCPINGMLLVIPAKSLIQDAPEEMVRKAQKISDQINRVQRVLDVRFPVFVMVTMCDLVTGFREFFEPLHGGDEQQQMLGWSNSQPIDVAFHTEMTEQYLSTVVGRLLRRRSLMLRDPTPQRDLSDSRLDEVDALFKLPDGFSQLSRTLKLYLQTIFVPTEWAAKPPFLRGIYFTSSMQEGSALDVELAKALGIPLDKLPEDGIWKRERALFLRDLFLDKVFQEKGLVSRASNVQGQYRRRKIALLGTCAAAAAFLLFLTWFGWRDLERRVGSERCQWHYVAEEFARGTPLPVIVPSAQVPGTFEYRGQLSLRVSGDQQFSLAKLHTSLFDAVKSPLNVPGVFWLTRPLGPGFDSERRNALRMIFENDILKPVIDCSCARIKNDREAWTPSATKALSSLIRMRANVCAPKDRLPSPEELENLFRFVLSDSDYRDAEKDVRVFANMLAWCYDPSANGRQQSWPPAWLAQDTVLVTNSVLAKGVERFIDYSVRSAGNSEAEFQEIVKLSEEVRGTLDSCDKRCGLAEAALFAVLEKNQERLLTRIQDFDVVKPQWDYRAKAFSNEVATALGLLSEFRQRRDKISLCASDQVVSNYYASLTQTSNRLSAAFASLKLPSAPASATNVTLVADIRSQMENAVKNIVDKPDAFKVARLREFERLDQRFAECVQPLADRNAHYLFPSVPEHLLDMQETWKERRKHLRMLKDTVVYGEFGQFCEELETLYSTCEKSTNCIPVVGKLHALSRATQKRLKSSEDSGNAFEEKEARSCLKCWSGLDENCVLARKSILALEADTFAKDYFMSGAKHDYVSRFWQDLARETLTILADAVEPEIQDQWKGLREWARFPLDVDAVRGKPLTPKELVQARRVLDDAEKRFGLSSADAKKTIGTGDRCDVDWIDEQLNRLSSPQLASRFAWIRAARKVAFALPDGVNEFSEFRIALVPDAQQKTLTVETGNKMENNACVVFENYYVSAKGNTDLTARSRMGSGDPLTQIGFPGASFTLSLYQYRDSKDMAESSAPCPGEEPWSLLNVLLDPCSKRDSDNPKKWFVPFRMKRGNQEVILWLQIETGNKEIPARSEWPQNLPE